MALQEDLDRAIEVVRRGGIVAYPTDTLYGLAVDPRREDAVKRLFAVKGRPVAMAIPLIAADTRQAMAAGRFGVHALRLAGAFWPGPLSIVVPAASGICRGVLGAGDTVAIRVPAHPLARGLAAGLGFPVTATSANLSGRPPTAVPGEVASSLGDRIDLVLDDGPAPGGAPSTVVAMERDGPRLVREGAIAWERVLKSLQ